MKSILTVENTIEQVIQTEIKELVYYKGAPYVKFLLLSIAVEFLGACMDKHDFQDHQQSLIRFNKALKKLFPKKYHKYAKKDSDINLFKDLRSGMIHKLSPLTQRIKLTERRHLKKGQDINMKEDNNGNLFIVLEDFYDDIDNACEKLKRINKAGSLPTKKMEQDYIMVSKNILKK